MYQKSQSYDVWFLRHGVRRTEFFVIRDCFLPFYPPMDLENQNLEKKWKKHLKALPFYKCLAQMTVIWYMVFLIWSATDKIFCHFGQFFALLSPPSPLSTQKIKILKKWNNVLEISWFYICAPKIMIRWCMVPEIWCVTDVIIFHFGPFFALLPP